MDDYSDTPVDDLVRAIRIALEWIEELVEEVTTEAALTRWSISCARYSRSIRRASVSVTETRGTPFLVAALAYRFCERDPRAESARSMRMSGTSHSTPKSTPALSAATP